MELSRDLKQGLRGEDVALMHRELAIIGLTVPDAERRETLFGQGTHEAVAQFQKQHCLEPTGVVDAETARAINAAVNAMTFTVQGKVVSRLRAGVGGLRVVIVDKNVGNDVQLAEAGTDDEGGYCTAFNVTDLRQRGKRRPDLQARASRGRMFLGASKVCYNASNHETLNVFLTTRATSALPSELETLTSSLSRHFNGNLRDLQESDQRQDITYLANKTGWDARAVALAALADQFSARTTVAGGEPQIVSPFFYALFRAGVPANEDGIYQITAKNAADIWKQAIAQGVIPANLESRIPNATEQFQRIAVERSLDGPALAGLSSLKEMLSVSLGNDPARHRRFAELYAEHRHNSTELWEAVRGSLGEAAEKRLRLDGQLGYLTLNNAPLIRKLHAAGGRNGVTESVSLAQMGYYRPNKWRDLIGEDAIPAEILGETNEERRTRYADVLAAQVRLSFPTMVVAQMVKEGETPISPGMRDQVHAFLTEHQGKFEIGTQPVERYIVRNQVQVPNEVAQEVTRIQRVYQITPSDGAMNALLKRGIDSAYAVTRYSQDGFIRTFKRELGGEANARQTYAKAQQTHNFVLNIAFSYLTAGIAPAIGEHSPGSYIDKSKGGDVIAYPTLEGLFGEMDFCACEHCRSILSPAAYLVDLLLFLDRDNDVWATDLDHWKDNHGNAPYPFADLAAWNDAGQPANTEITPLQVLLDRRPDIQHLPLTCENTNTPLPYIDLVNETLEYFIANDTEALSLKGYTGHSTGVDDQPEELLASPQFVRDAAYATLAGVHFPPPLPFHQPLENLRRYFNHFEAPLPEMMEVLRQNNELERPTPNDPSNPVEYGWRDILMEELGLSRAEHKILTNYDPDPPLSTNLTLQQLYGFNSAMSEAEVILRLSNAKNFTRRVGISYEEIIEILKTRFINPNSTLIPRLERLGVPFSTLKALKDGVSKDGTAFSSDDFGALLPAGLNPVAYGGDPQALADDGSNYAEVMGSIIKDWVTSAYDNIMSLIVVTNPTDEEDLCTFENLEFRYSDPDKIGTAIRVFEFVRLIRFIRLWKKLGWTIEQTDKAIIALYPADQTPDDTSDLVNQQRLDVGFLTLLPRVGMIRRIMRALKLKPKKDLLPLLACFAPIDTHGSASLYRQMFLSGALLKQDPAFDDDGLGGFLTDSSKKLLDHAEALRAAFLLTVDELNLITVALDFDSNTGLNVENISAVFRIGWLARKLKLSVRELRLLTKFTGVNPFSAPDPPNPPMLGLIEILSRLRAASLKPVEALYLIWNQDISGRSAPDEGEILALASTLRSDFATIESEFALADDPDGQIARARMAQVYGNEATDHFFGLLDNKVVTDVSYSHNQATLEQPIVDAGSGHVSYDNLRKRLSYNAGVMPDPIRDALIAVAGVPVLFESAVAELYEHTRVFFDRYPELLPLYDAYIASSEPLEKRRFDLLASFLPELKRRRKRQQALQVLSAAAQADAVFTNAIFDDAGVLHAMGNDTLPSSVDPKTLPALDDLTALETVGLSVQFFFADTTSGNPNVVRDAEANLAYAATGDHKLPPNGNTPDNTISGIWSGYLEVPENGFYNLRIEADAGAEVTLELDGKTIEPLPPQNGATVWSNKDPIELLAGTLYRIVLTVEKVKDMLTVRWETTGRGWEVVPPRYLYSQTLTDHLRVAYIRFLKAVSLATSLRLSANEIAHFAKENEYLIDGQGWLNSLTVSGSPDDATSQALLKAFTALLQFSRIKADLSPDDQRLLAVLKNPESAAKPAAENVDSLLFSLTRWESDSLEALLTRFANSIADLAHIEIFQRICAALAPVKKLRIPASTLINSATNEPSAAAVRDLQAALRARYDESDWLNVLQPINDQMRELQRDALVAYILHQMRENPATAHIDTPDKLFEYFLMDVQMESCMQTSRIRHALSSVQLFIERCFMNLEPRVAPSVLEAKHWEWMKRYRVWEANRKVFLWPENWLEPELRDDQSPFFKEAMSELLQSDITEDRAGVALLNYLSKLEEVAKLEPCGIHYAEGEPGVSPDIAHVVARTAGANRKYYYRRRDGADGPWTPWEQIKLDIEDNPVIPVVWKDRLFLFWLRILKEAPVDGEIPKNEELPTDKPLVDYTPNDLKTDAQFTAQQTAAKVTIKAVLCWSEYYNGKWQAPKTSDINRAATYGVGNYGFDRARLWLRVRKDWQDPEALRVFVGWGTSFLLYNTHSLPVVDDSPDPGALPQEEYRVLHTRTYDTLLIGYYKKGAAQASHLHNVLKNKITDHTIEPNHHDLLDRWTTPFFYWDSRHVFYVTTQKAIKRANAWNGYQVTTEQDSVVAQIQPVAFAKKLPPGGEPYEFWSGDIGHADPAFIERFVSEDAYINKGIVTTGAVHYGEISIGPAGGLPVSAIED
jgi:peptidoglycan hydrolase-like protein with peptidoglycan-binding domain